MLKYRDKDSAMRVRVAYLGALVGFPMVHGFQKTICVTCKAQAVHATSSVAYHMHKLSDRQR